jgi:glycosyltransferase involved in cell wall biosynthesis
MKCPTIGELPPPPPGRTGWPWTVGSVQLPPRMADGSEWPAISIVTPNYNYERYLEETIRSVLLQGYPNVEYIVQDDGSSDGSIEIIKKYQDFLAFWSSEPNCGQQAVINRGLRRTSGEILAYINSDDYYAPNAFAFVARAFNQNPGVDFINGKCVFVDEGGERVGGQFGDINSFDEVLDLWNFWWRKRFFVQPETFWRRKMWERIGDFRTDLHITFDYEYWCRMFLAGTSVKHFDVELACFRFQRSQKTGNIERTVEEELRIVKNYIWDPASPLSRHRRRELQGLWLYDTAVMGALKRSAAQESSRPLRWLRLLGIGLTHPQLWTVPQFKQRLASPAKRLTGL